MISLFFTGDVLDRIEGDVAAASGTPAAAAAQERSRVVEIPRQRALRRRRVHPGRPSAGPIDAGKQSDVPDSSRDRRCSGRMGRNADRGRAEGRASCSPPPSIAATPFIGRDAGEMAGVATGVLITDDAAAAIGAADCVIDFTRPEGTLAHLALARAAGKAMVIGTTGFDAAGKTAIAAAAEHVPWSSRPTWRWA